MSYRDKVLQQLQNRNDMLLHAVMGLCGESGEVSELVKKGLFQNKPFTRERMIEELGDVRWYLELACIAVHTSIQELEKSNSEKLQKRYENVQ